MQRAMRFRLFADVFKSLPLVLFATALAWVVFYESQFFFEWSPVQNVRVIYGPDPFEDSIAVAQYIRAHSASDARIAVVGSEPEIYFYARRHSVTGYIALMEPQPNARKMQEDMMGEIEAAKPEFVVLVMYKYSWLMGKESDPAIFKWTGDYTKKFYEPVGIIGKQTDGGVIWVSGKAANDFHNPLQEFMAIYQRKPDAN